MLPLDVLQVILTYLGPHELAKCCRVNHAVYPIAFDALYRDLRPTQRNVLPLCLKLSNDPTLARRVRSFVLCNPNVDMYLGAISDALLCLPRLHTLVLFIGHMSSWILPQKDACPFQLTSLASGFFWDTTMLSFLAFQHDLKHLALPGSTSPPLLHSISPQLIPNLVSIYAPMSVVEVLAPGRPIRDITAFGLADIKASISSLSRTTVPVQRLMLNFGYLQSLEFGHLSESTPNLVYLSIDANNVKPDDEDVRDLSTSLSPSFINSFWLDDR